VHPLAVTPHTAQLVNPLPRSPAMVVTTGSLGSKLHTRAAWLLGVNGDDTQMALRRGVGVKQGKLCWQLA
jgi:hypothetical protein